MTTLKDVFALSPDNIQINSNGKWGELKEKIDSEIKGIKWIKAAPDLLKKICELLNIEIPDLFIAAWEKEKVIKEALLKSKQSPGKTIEIELAEHTIESELNPYIEIRIQGIPTPKKIKFKVQVSFNLKGFILEIQKGAVTEILPLSCEVTGTFKCEEILLAKKDFEPIKLPDSFVMKL
jgi:hypothetical protein